MNRKKVQGTDIRLDYWDGLPRFPPRNRISLIILLNFGPMKSQGTPKAPIRWDSNDEPYSTEFEDMYYPTREGLEVSEYVFLQANNLPKAWKSSGDLFTIGEIGFGTGLNFLATARAWCNYSRPDQRLHFVSCEKYPLEVLEIDRAISRFEPLMPYWEILRARYPSLVNGFRRIELPEWRVQLTLLFADALDALQQLDARVNAWYLDGFAPTRNPKLWSGELCREIARMSVTGATLGTFSAAGAVRRNLESVGFAIEKIPGYGTKRESIKGYYTGCQRSPVRARPSSIAVIGAGVAGTALVHAMAKRGVSTTLIERRSQIASEASGNPMAVVYPYFTERAGSMGRFYLAAFEYTLRHIERLLSIQPDLDWNPCGALQFPSSERLRRLQHNLSLLNLPGEIARPLVAQQAARIAGIDGVPDGIFYERAGLINPRKLCDAHLETARSLGMVREVLLNTFAVSLHKQSEGWTISDSSGTEVAHCDGVVLANAFNAKEIAQTAWLPLKHVRGQLFQTPSTVNSTHLRTVLCYEGYTTPAFNGSHLIGASFKRGDPLGEVRPEENEIMLEKLRRWAPSLQLEATRRAVSRVAFRTTTYDKLPFVGPVCDVDLTLSKSRESGLSYHENLYTLLGFGSRGFTSAPLCAELLASLICDEPLPIERDLCEALSPDRYVRRQIRRREFSTLSPVRNTTVVRRSQGG